MVSEKGTCERRRGKYRDRTKATEKALNWKEFQEHTVQDGFGEVNSHVWQELRLCSVEEEEVSWKGPAGPRDWQPWNPGKAFRPHTIAPWTATAGLHTGKISAAQLGKHD